LAHGRLLGFLSLEKQDCCYYTPKHAGLLESLAGHVGLALLNALTYEEMERASVTDFLTSAYNHRYFQQQIRRELELAQRIGYPVSLLMLDLDFFKDVNDRYGHLCGDRVLQLLAGRLRTELQHRSSGAPRWGRVCHHPARTPACAAR
jgi:GGDEF domain-containing protein